MDHDAYWKAIVFMDRLDKRKMDNKAAGWIYAVRNKEFVRPLIKIGMSQNPPHERAKQLASTGVPGSFELVYCVHSAAALMCERSIHDALVDYRFERGKEFFEAPIGLVVATMDEFAGVLPIRMSQGRSGRYNERSNPLPQPFQPAVVGCSQCEKRNRVRPLAIEVHPACGNCGTRLTVEGLGATPQE